MRECPKHWPSECIYSSQCVYLSDQKLLDRFIGAEGDERSPLIERGVVHEALVLKCLTQVKGHPLGSVKYGKRVQLGVFAEAKIAAGQMLGEYVGQVQVVSSKRSLSLKDFDHAWTYEKGPFLFVLNGKKVANELAFVNDYRGLGEVPNVAPKWVEHRGLYHLVFEAITEIKKGQEVLIDYGDSYWQAACRQELLPQGEDNG